LVEEKLDEVLPDLAGSERVLAHVADLTDAGSVAALVEAVAGRFGRIDGLVNVVGGFRAGSPVHELDLETWDYLFRSERALGAAGLPGGDPAPDRGRRRADRECRGQAALSGAANMAAYSASKAVVLRLTGAWPPN
jgi:NAD(P)-dependent dehydrogenase (short-subunit alcohol dehydrogenase family)